MTEKKNKKEKKYILGIDLGGITAKCAIADLSGEIVHRFILKTSFGYDIIPKLSEQSRAEIKKIGLNYHKNIQIIAFGCCGPLDAEKGISINAGKMGWYNFPVLEESKRFFGSDKEIYLLNDSRSATVGEWKRGAGKKYKSFVLLTIGTGVGGGIIYNNKIFTGAHNFAGEFGHGGFYQSDRQCGCGLSYCLEGLSSALGIEWYLDHVALAKKHSKLAELKAKLGRNLHIKDCVGLIKVEDEVTIEALKYALKPLAFFISTIIFTLDPEAVLIGGGPSALGKPLIDIIQYWLKQCLWKNRLPLVDIKTCSLGNDAGVLGVIEYARAKSLGEEI